MDELTFPTVMARHVRMVGVLPHPSFGYSLFALEVGTPDLARGRVTTASSSDTGREPALATNGSYTTRWAVSRAERPRPDSWLAVDLGAPASFDRVRLYWEAAAGRAYRIESSVDGNVWSRVADHPRPDLRSTGRWLDIDGRAGLVVHGSPNPITVTGDTVALSDGPAAGMVVEGYPRATQAGLRTAAATGAPRCTPSTVRASAADGFLSLFNLSSTPAIATVSVPQNRAAIWLYRGRQVVTETGTDYELGLDGASARIEPPRFTLHAMPGQRVAVGVRAEVTDGQHLSLTGAPSGLPAMLTLVQRDGMRMPVVLPAGQRSDITLPTGRPYPLDDLALGRPTFPTAPMPAGMSDPAAAVDDNPNTAWTPGPAGRMVVDLGAAQRIGEVGLEWTVAGLLPGSAITTSTDGRAYSTPVAMPSGRRVRLPLDRTARYLALAVPGWRPGQAALVNLSVRPTGQAR